MYNLVPKQMFDVFDNMLNSFNSFYEDDNFLKNVGKPITDIVDTKDNVMVTLEIPGVGIDDIDVSVKDNILTVKGEKKSEKVDKKEDKVIQTERYYGSFEKRVYLGNNIDPDNIDATYENGVLRLTVPKVEKDKDSIKIKVK